MLASIHWGGLAVLFGMERRTRTKRSRRTRRASSWRRCGAGESDGEEDSSFKRLCGREHPIGGGRERKRRAQMEKQSRRWREKTTTEVGGRSPTKPLSASEASSTRPDLHISCLPLATIYQRQHCTSFHIYNIQCHLFVLPALICPFNAFCSTQCTRQTSRQSHRRCPRHYQWSNPPCPCY